MKLTAVAIRKAGPGKLHDGNGLILVRGETGGKWLYRYTHLGRRRDMGLGTWPALSLAEARAERDRWAKELARGIDPIDERKRQREAEAAERDRHDPTLAEIVGIVFEARKATLRGDGTRGRWRSPLDKHVLPKIGRKRLSQLHQTDLRDALAPIWKTLHPTAQKAVQRLRIVFRDARLMGYDCDPFTVDSAERMLGAHRHVTRHIPATPWQDIPALFQRLDVPVSSAQCLRWIILTLVRAHAARAARVSEIEGNTWTVPADRVKGREGVARAFRVPLSGPALSIARPAMDLGQDLIFTGHRNRPISDRALEKYLSDIGEEGRPHGFRTSFRSWVQDTDACSYDVAETILGHVVGGTVERSYARSDLLDRRRAVMDAWSAFVTGQAADVLIKPRRTVNENAPAGKGEGQ